MLYAAQESGLLPTSLKSQRKTKESENENENRSNMRACVFLQAIANNHSPNARTVRECITSTPLRGRYQAYLLVPRSNRLLRIDNLDAFQRHQAYPLVPRSKRRRVDNLDLLGGPNGKCFFPSTRIRVCCMFHGKLCKKRGFLKKECTRVGDPF